MPSWERGRLEGSNDANPTKLTASKEENIEPSIVAMANLT